MTETPPRKSDLGVRTLSAIVMLAVAGAALWLDGWWWTAFVALVGLVVVWEWVRLVLRISTDTLVRSLATLAGLVYIGFGSLVIYTLGDRVLMSGSEPTWLVPVLWLVAVVVATDVGAYFAGRTIGGPKIAPSISPSKTWAGLIGGMICAALAMAGLFMTTESDGSIVRVMTGGAIAAVVAQAGDFLESWMKRRAGVKDSSNLIPGHGGFFDRLDGLLAVACVAGIYLIWTFSTLRHL